MKICESLFLSSCVKASPSLLLTSSSDPCPHLREASWVLFVRRIPSSSPLVTPEAGFLCPDPQCASFLGPDLVLALGLSAGFSSVLILSAALFALDSITFQTSSLSAGFFSVSIPCVALFVGGIPSPCRLGSLCGIPLSPDPLCAHPCVGFHLVFTSAISAGFSSVPISCVALLVGGIPSLYRIGSLCRLPLGPDPLCGHPCVGFHFVFTLAISAGFSSVPIPCVALFVWTFISLSPRICRRTLLAALLPTSMCW